MGKPEVTDLRGMVTNWRQPGIGESVGMKAAAIDFHTQNLLESYVAQMHFRAKMVQQRELAGLVRSLKHRRADSKGFDKQIRVSGVERTLAIKQADAPRAFSGF